MEYRPVMAPTRCGKRCLTTTGSSTLATAIPASASALNATNSAVACAKERSRMPAVIATRPVTMTASAPYLRARRGAANPISAKHTAGRDTSSPASVAPIPREARASSSTGPRLVTAGRRFSAARISAPIASRRTHAADGAASRRNPAWPVATDSSFAIGSV